MKIIVDTNIWISFTIGKKLSTLKTLLNSKQVEIYVCEEFSRYDSSRLYRIGR